MAIPAIFTHGGISIHGHLSFFGAYNPAGEGIVLFKNRDYENYTYCYKRR